MNEALTWILDLVQSVDPVLRTLLAGVGILLETSILIGLIVPGDTVVLVASTAVGGPVEYVALVVAVVVGALCGESIGFGLGRWFGPRIRAVPKRPVARAWATERPRPLQDGAVRSRGRRGGGLTAFGSGAILRAGNDSSRCPRPEPTRGNCAGEKGRP